MTKIKRNPNKFNADGKIRKLFTRHNKIIQERVYVF